MIYYNEPFAAGADAKSSELVGQDIKTLVSFEENLPWPSVFDRVMQNSIITIRADFKTNHSGFQSCIANVMALQNERRLPEHAILILRLQENSQPVTDDDTMNQDATPVTNSSLHKYRKLIADAVEIIDAGLLLMAPDGTIEYANKAAARLLGRRPDKLLGSNIRQQLTAHDNKLVDGFFLEYTKSSRCVCEVHRKSKKKQDAITEITLVKMPSDDGALEAVVAVLRDVTDLHILKSHLRHSQKLEAIGLLASGFAHNINSPLAAIIMTAEMAILNNPDAREWNDILQAAARVTDIVTNLMIKTRQEQSEEEVEIDINELVQTELKFLEANLFFKHIIELDLQLNEKLPSVKGLYGDFSQCFQNLVQNALDAMTQGEETRLTVRTELSEQGQSIILKVKDTGCGIPQEYVNKIFDPFFSTKSLTDDADQFRPSGTGLGLHTSQQLLQKYGANIRVSSEPGDGTEFTITIPVISQNKNEKAS
ncbi:PAS domain-containing protein [bacterium]|nr:PAS domain-containing protein [bacterium]